VNFDAQGLAVIVSATLPVALIVSLLVFRWHYLRVVRRTMYAAGGVAPERGKPPPLERSRPEPLVLARCDAATFRDDLPSRALTAAIHDARAVRTVLVVTGAVFVLIAAVLVAYGQAAHFDARVAVTLAYFSTIAGSVIVLAFARSSVSGIVMAASIWLGVGLLYLAVVLALPWSLMPSLIWSGVGFSAAPLAAVGLLALKRLRPLLVAFVPMVGLWLLLSGLAIGVLELLEVTFETRPSPMAVAIGLLNLVIGVGLAVHLLRRGVSRRSVMLLAATAATGLYVTSRELPLVLAIPAGTAVNAVTALAVGWLIGHFLRLKATGWLPDEILHFGFCWLVLTAFVPMLANSPLWPPWFVLPFAASMAVLFLLLRRRWRSAAVAPANRLLLLRVFERTRARQRLLDALDEGWRRVGRVDLVVGADLADRTLGAAALENVLLGRVHRQFVTSHEEAAQRIARLPNHRALDGRYPLNELHCLPHIWRHVVAELAGACDVVLMDLRGLRRTNAGALFELALVLDRVPLDRIVLLVDGRTDESALNDTANSAWTRLADDSPNQGRLAPRLCLLSCSGSRADDRAITRALFHAAAPRHAPDVHHRIAPPGSPRL
jgi:hypothetical protein